MGGYVANEVVKLMVKRDIVVKKSNILVLGITFKENCPDVRNTRIVDIISELRDYEIDITICDPWANSDEVMHEYGLSIVNDIPSGKFDAVIMAVAHNSFMEVNWTDKLNENGLIYDVKGCLDKNMVTARL